ncbi:MAG: PadR family transcriptional regulator [Alphaproteobacteria bacterium]|nr:PadR family transcriptional regulator [Alphaproteobacteria bacterium]
MDVRTLCLAVLSKGEATGYEIKKAFEEGPFAHFQRASFGSIYPALSRLLAEGLVEAHAMEQDGRPDKKMYRLTAQGQATFHAALTVDPEPDQFRSDLLFLLFFACHLPPARAATLLDAATASYRGHVARVSGIKAEREAVSNATGQPLDPGREFVAGFGITLYQAAADYLDANRDALLADLQGHAEAAE